MSSVSSVSKLLGFVVCLLFARIRWTVNLILNKLEKCSLDFVKSKLCKSANLRKGNSAYIYHTQNILLMVLRHIYRVLFAETVMCVLSTWVDGGFHQFHSIYTNHNTIPTYHILYTTTLRYICIYWFEQCWTFYKLDWTSIGIWNCRIFIKRCIESFLLTANLMAQSIWRSFASFEFELLEIKQICYWQNNFRRN